MSLKQNVSPLQVIETRNFSGLTTSNNLSSAYATEPEKIGTIMAYANGYAANNVMTLLTGGLNNTKFVNNREYEWDLHSENERAIEVIADCPDGGVTPGYGGTSFRLYLKEKWFDVTDNLVSDKGTQVHIVEDPYEDAAGGWVYKVVLTDPNKPFIELSEVAKGARFSKDYSTVEEFSNKGGGHGFQTPIKLRNQLTTLRKKYTVSRNAAKIATVIQLTHPDTGEVTKLWTKMEEWTALSKWYRELDRSYIYSKYNKNAQGEVTLQGENKRPIYHGAGFREQISPANRRYYTKLTYNILDDFLLDLSYSANKWGGDHNFVGLTGKMGMREFDRAISDYQKGKAITITDNGTFITGKGDSLTFTGYFRSVQFLNGITLTMKEFPEYDDTTRHRTLHPKSKKPLESYRISILNFGQKEGKSNITKVALTDSDMMMWHVCGSTTPTGDVAKSLSTMRSNSVDGYEVHLAAECGIMIQDPTSCGELIMKLD